MFKGIGYTTYLYIGCHYHTEMSVHVEIQRKNMTPLKTEMEV